MPAFVEPDYFRIVIESIKGNYSASLTGQLVGLELILQQVQVGEALLLISRLIFEL